MPPDPLGILLISGSYERAHYAFLMAAGAAAVGRRVVLFATHQGCRALLRDWSSLEGAGADPEVRAKGVAGFAELREAAIELGVQLLACDSGLLIAGLDPAALLGQAEVAGVPSFLSEVGPGAIVTL